MLGISLALAALPMARCNAQAIEISDAQAEVAGKKLWLHECGGTVAGLTSWNAGEDFASLGIGHYIWYPADRRGPFEESFPGLISFLQKAGVELPGWLRTSHACPWNSRQEFERERNGERMNQLRAILTKTVALQARFSASRLENALPKMLASAKSDQQDAIRGQFRRVAGSPGGVYALVDYVNFKGEGVLATERYQGQGWGLLDVLAGMQGNPLAGPGAEVTRDFSRSAARVLSTRVANAPVERHEEKWLKGWKDRVASYAP